MIAPAPILHATLVARRFPDGWRGALLRGPSGAGKSELALRLLDCGLRLVADDRVIVWASSGRVFGRAPGVLHGLIEARHVAIARLPALPLAPLRLVVDLADATLERLPDPDVVTVAGVDVRRLSLPPFEAGTPTRIAAALDAGGAST